MNTKGGESGRTWSAVGVEQSRVRAVGKEGELRFAHTKISGDSACARVGRESERAKEMEREGRRESNTAEGETREPSQSRSRRETALLEGSVCVVVYVNVRKRISQIFSLSTTLATL